MASVVTLPSAPNTGLSSLASVLLGSATDYASQKRADSVEARRRAQRLEDITAERQYAEKQYDRARDDRLSDISSERSYKDAQDTVKRDERLEDIRDAREWEQMIRSEGSGVAQARLNQLTENEAAVMARMAEREKRLSAPEPQPTREQVMSRALAIARQTTGKSTPPTAEIEASVPQAIEEARAVLNQSWQRDRLDAMESQRIDASLLTRIGAEKNTITNIFRRVGLADTSQPSPAPQAASAGPQTKDLATVQREFAESLRTELAKQRQGAPDAAPVQRLFNPVDDPIIRREQELRNAEAEQARLAPVQQIQSQLADIDQQIRAAQTTPPQPMINVGAVSGGFGRPVPTPRGQQAGVLSDLYTRQEELRRKLGTLQAPVINLPQSARPPIIQLTTER